MNIKFFGLLITGMVANGACYAMDSDSESNDFLVRIENRDVAFFIQQENIDLWLRDKMKESSTIADGYAYLQGKMPTIKLCKILESVQSNLLAKRTTSIPMNRGDMYVRFKTDRSHSVRAVRKALMKSPYAIEVVCADTIEADLLEKIERNECSNKCSAEPCMDPIAPDAVSSDFLVYIGANRVAEYIKALISLSPTFNLAAVKRKLCKDGCVSENEKILREGSLVFQLFGIIGKAKKRFGAEITIAEISDGDGMYLKLHCALPQNVNAVADMLKKSLYVTKIIPDQGVEYLTADILEKTLCVTEVVPGKFLKKIRKNMKNSSSSFSSDMLLGIDSPTKNSHETQVLLIDALKRSINHYKRT